MRILSSFAILRRPGYRASGASFLLLLGAASTALSAIPPAEAVARITARAAEPAFVERHHLLHAIDDEFFTEAAEDLFRFLETSEAPAGMERNDFLSLKNDVVDRLIAVGVRPAAHLRLALNTVSDKSADFVWRDYYVQKLPALLAADGVRPSDRNRAAAILRSLVRGDAPGLTGTALIAARGLSLEDGAVADLVPSAAELGGLALRCARDKDSLLIDRVTALQIAAELGEPGTADFAASVLADDGAETPAMLRVSALAALGVTGDTSHHELVRSHSLSPDVRLRAAARAALDRMPAN